jgi:hypothetical protein
VDFVRRESEFACGHLLTLGKTLSSSSKLVVVFRGTADVTDKEVVNFCNLLPLPLRGRCPWNALKYGTAWSMFPRWVPMRSLLRMLWLNLDVQIEKTKWPTAMEGGSHCGFFRQRRNRQARTPRLLQRMYLW